MRRLKACGTVYLLQHLPRRPEFLLMFHQRTLQIADLGSLSLHLVSQHAHLRAFEQGILFFTLQQQVYTVTFHLACGRRCFASAAFTFSRRQRELQPSSCSHLSCSSDHYTRQKDASQTRLSGVATAGASLTQKPRGILVPVQRDCCGRLVLFTD